jgi:hypothetical protein
MVRNYDANDLLWTDDGDWFVGRDGDLADTKFDALLAISQDMYDRSKSDKKDYSENPRVGATLTDFVGEPNTAEAGTQIEKRMLSNFQYGDAISPADVSIRAFPLSIDTIGIKVSLATMPTTWNKSSRRLSAVYVYSYAENNIYPVIFQGD